MELYRLYGTVVFNRELKDNETISLGGYHFKTNFDKCLDFDFCDYEYSKEGNSVSFIAKNPDATTFPDIEFYKVSDFRNISEIEDIYMDLEGCEDDLEVIDIKDLFVEFVIPHSYYNNKTITITVGMSNMLLSLYFDRIRKECVYGK